MRSIVHPAFENDSIDLAEKVTDLARVFRYFASWRRDFFTRCGATKTAESSPCCYDRSSSRPLDGALAPIYADV